MKLFVLLVTTIFVLGGTAQSDFFELNLKVISDKNQGGVTVELLSAKMQKKLRANSKGVLLVNSISYGEIYELILSGDNFVTKKIKIDAKRGFFRDDVDNNVLELEIEMIEALLYVDYDIITNSPVGIIEIDSESGNLENNRGYAVQRENEIEEFLATTEALSKKLQEEFRKLLKDAKIGIDNKKYISAESILRKAEEIAINEKTKRVRELLEGAKSRKGDEQDAIKKIITVADKLLSEKDFNSSIALYKRVVRLDPENVYALEKIKEINFLLVNMEKENTAIVDCQMSTSEILARAKLMQENRIDNYYNR